MKEENISLEKLIEKQIKFWNINKPFSDTFRDEYNYLCTCGKRLRRGIKEGDICPNCNRIIPESI